MPSNEKYNKGKLKKKLTAGVLAGALVIHTSPAVAAVTNNETEKNSTYIPETPVHIISNGYADVADLPSDVVEYIDIPDDLVPLNEGLDQETDFVTINEINVPLADAAFVDVPLVDVPLAELPQTGIKNMDLNWVLGLGFSLSGLLLTIRGKKS